jgi:subfamily B ATP-binding cassette protein MsbA
VSNFTRLFRYVWPHRRKAYISVIFACLVAGLWGINLSMSFLVVKVFLESQSLAEYVAEEIEIAQTESDESTAKLKHLDDVKPHDNSDVNLRLLKKRRKYEQKSSTASRKLLIMKWVQAKVVPWLPRDLFDMYALILGVLLLTTVLKGLCVFVQEVLIGSVVELTAMGVRKECFRRTLALDYQTLSMNGTSQLMSHFTYDMNVMMHGLRLLGGKVIREPLKALTCLFLAFLVSWQLTLLSLLFAPLAALIFYRIGRMLKQASHRLMESMSRIYKTLEETFDAMKIVIAFNGGLRHRQRFHHDNKEYYAKSMKLVKIDALTSPTTEAMGLLACSIALLPGAYLVLRGKSSIWGITLTSSDMSIAQLSMLYVYLAGVIDPARKLLTTYTKLKRATAAADRIFGLVDLKPLVVQSPDAIPMPRHVKTIEFKKIDFAYASNNKNGAIQPIVLEEVSLKVNAGEVIVVVGENGSGKSTLVNLLPRFYDPDRGTVLIDGVDIREVRLKDLRRHIGVVTQETLLFDDTIYENIRYGKLGATRNEIEQAALRAHVTQFLDQLPDGFETLVGEKGRRLSGGQRQRIALARAILRDPAILILDEATSAIDSQSERLIHEALRSFVVGRTTFLITHSISQSILDFVTRIVVMDQGRLVAAGSHEELIETCPVYQRLYRAQMHQQSATDDSFLNAERNSQIEDDADEPNILPLSLKRKTISHHQGEGRQVPPAPNQRDVSRDKSLETDDDQPAAC